MNQVLLVEGRDDLFVFTNIFEKHKVNESFKIIDKEGVDNILKGLPIYAKSDLATIGIIIDADSGILQKWRRLKSVLSEIGYVVPNKPLDGGTIIRDENLPVFGVWIMPDNNENGMLEDFVKYLIPSSDKIMPFIEETLDLLESKKINKYKPIHKSKASIHTWLAWQKTPGTPMGLAINKTYLDTNQKLCKSFVDWINKFYNGCAKER